MQRSGGGVVLQVVAQLPPPADAGRSAIQMRFAKATAFLVLWTFTSWWVSVVVDTSFHTVRTDSFSGVICGFALLAFGSFVVGRYTEAFVFHSVYAIIGIAGWIPHFAGYANFRTVVTRASPYAIQVWAPYLILSVVLLAACPILARYGARYAQRAG